MGSHEFIKDDRNLDILININGELFHRNEAKISVFDSGFILGDGVWEGLRLHNGIIAFLDDHLQRLYQGAKALDLDIGLSKKELSERVYQTIQANDMHDHVHIRLMVTRGVKTTPYQDPRATLPGATIVIIPEYKIPNPEKIQKGVRLFTTHVRRGYPDVQDQKMNSHSKINCILGCIQATKAGYDEALMLDPHGFVATCNSTHFFIVTKGEVWTSTGDYCLGGITRSKIIQLCEENDIPVYQKNFSLFDVYGADECFITGTFAGLTPVNEVDGRVIGDPSERKMIPRLQKLYLELINRGLV
ncbi:MAG TPA: aminotransferase class IV [Gammaproteobacteria bacterium]|nr:aminotransferase class IV [Xanthomonadales bacterium]MCB1593295.1 aminotransferase class IV [Xanthomonadales bacterium]HOP23015.1 aminotransferase class IV [Gammaproteobacteria bacterium]HPI96296.1 aminotransferase class IV [Gammaproteobacteria bacterium]HPQ87387.1 aminotransferase class IV [Gammaproteobacteria bacterium]